MKTRFFIYISFKGTSYHGWQAQINSVTVQQMLEKALSLVLGEKISVKGAGRTDAGVHALLFVAHFESSMTDLEEDGNTVYRLNRILPPDISVNSIRKVIPDAHARFSAISRTYRYYISRTKDPFTTDSSWYLYGKINLKSLNDAARILTGYTDFTSFSKLHSDNRTNVCRILSASWEESDKMLIFTIKADRFLRNMVRAIVGTMIRTGLGKMSLDEFEEIIKAGDRSKAGKSAEAKGLFLIDIEYPAEIFAQ